MRDLYRALGLNATSSGRGLIESAMKHCPDAQVVHRAQAVLLDDERRAHYDTVLNRVRDIAEIRRRLGIPTTAAWRDSVHTPDFSAAASETQASQIESLRRRAASTHQAAALRRPMPLADRVRVGCWGIVALAILVGLAQEALSPATPTEHTSRPPQSRPQLDPPFMHPPVIMPMTGRISTTLACRAPLTMATRDPRHGFYVKLVRSDSTLPVVEYFIRPGEVLKDLAPTGDYELRYAAGETWYGPQHLFGPNAAYSKAGSKFHFRETQDGFEGYTIELFLQPNGNLRTQKISPTEF
jgi:hypothetical protein